MAQQYVKFMRGSTAAFASLATKDRDTLYFIYDDEVSGGRLYLGERLIAGDDIYSTSIDALKDVLISENLVDNSVIVYNQEEKQWMDKPLSEILTVFLAPTDESTGVAGLVPAPAQGQYDAFLRSDGQWVTIDLDTELKIDEKVLTYNDEEALTLVGLATAETGAQLTKAADGSISWVKPDTTTAEGQAAEIGALKVRTEALEVAVNGKPATDDEPEVEGLIAKVENLETKEAAAEKLAEAKEYTNTEVAKVSDALNAFENTVGYVPTEDKSLVEVIDETFAKKVDVAALEEAIGELIHFKAEVVDSIDAVTAEGVLYLIKDESATGVDKYNEYILIDGVATLIGDTTTDLSNYYNKTEADDKIATAKQEAIAAAALAEEAKGYAVAADVEAALEDKVDKVDGARLITEEEATKLNSLADIKTVDGATFELSEDGKLSIKEISASTVTDLTSWINEKAGTVKGLSENNFSDALLAKLNGIEEGAEKNYIKSVSNDFEVSAEGALTLKSITSAQVSDLTELLAAKASAKDVEDLKDEVADIKAAITWVELV